MAKTKKEKQNIVDEYIEKLKDLSALFVLHPEGLTPNDATVLRKQLKAQQASFNTVKNTLFRIALDKSEITYNDLDFSGENAVIFSHGDPSESAKIVYEFLKENEKGTIKGGFIENSYISKEKVETLATLPPKEQLYAMTVGTIAAPITNFLYVLQANITGLMTVLKNISEQENSES